MNKEERAEYNRKYYRAKRSEQLLAAVPEDVPGEPGRVEAAVRAEIESLGVDRPGSVEAALAMARLIDTPAQWSQHSSAHRRLESALAELRSVSGVRGKRLASVQKLSSRVS